MPTLRRDLGLVETTAVAVSMMLGSGIFFGPALTAREFPDARIVLALWAVGGVVALVGGWTFGRLAARTGGAAGPYAYLRDAYGPLPAFLFAWTSFVVIAPTSTAVLASVFASNLAVVSPLTARGLALVGVWSIAAFTFFNVIGVKAGGRVQAALSALKVALVVGLASMLLFAPPAAPFGAPATIGTEAAGRWSLAFVGVLFSYGGFEYAVLATREVRDAERTVPRALLLGTAIVVVLYLLAVASYLARLGAPGMAAAVALAPEAARGVLPRAAEAVAIAVVVSAAGTINAIALLGPRATHAAAEDGAAPAWTGRVARRWGTPVAAILLQAALSTAFLLSGVYDTLAAYTVVGVAVYIVPAVLVLPMLRRREGAPRGAGWWEDAGALVVAGTYAWFLVFLFLEAPRTALVGCGLVAAGLVVYPLLRRRR
ncbi:MAG TPA: amino acid permease [Candidatus Thermoplasmatota archaeon]|nr:amino acid permease [Candidatus Thermoplasmatota archaeon]